MGKPNPIHVHLNTPEGMSELADRVASLTEFKSRNLTGRPVEPGRSMKLQVPSGYPFKQVRDSDYVVATYGVPFAYHHPAWGWNMVDRRVLSRANGLSQHWTSVLRHYRIVEEILTDPAFVAADVRSRLADAEQPVSEPEIEVRNLTAGGPAFPDPEAWERLGEVLATIPQHDRSLPRWRPVTSRVNTYHLVREDDDAQTRCGLPVITTGPDASPEPVSSRATLPPGSRECPFCRNALAVA